MARLPVVGSDDNAWGDILNTYLSVEHASDGKHVSLDLLTKPAANLDLNSHKIINLSTPTLSTDAVTKAYVDALNSANDSLVVHLAGIETVTGAKTFSAKVVISAAGTTTGGLQVTGGTNGYSSEVYFIGAASITDNTANGTMNFSHLANANTGGWSWANGTSGGNTQALLSSTGLFKAFGGFDSGGLKVANVGFCTVSTDAATKGYVDTRSIDQFASAASFVNMATNRIINVGDPSGLQDAATRNYIDFMHTASKSANYPLTSNDQVIFANGTFTLTLLNASGNTGRWCYIVNTGSGTVTVGTGGGNINGASTLTMSTQYAGKKFFSDGTNWFAI